MPPKKKGKKGKKGKEDKKEKEEEPEALGFPEELSKDFYILKIHDLERMLVRYEKKHKELQDLYNHLMNDFKGVSKERKEKVSFLKKTMEQRDDEISEFKDRLFGLQQHKDTEKEARELELQRLRTDYQEMKDQLTSENNVAAAKLAALEEFKRERESLMAKYQALEAEYQQLLDDHQAAMDQIDLKKMMDRDRLKKDMVTRVNLVAADFRKVSNKQMADTTKRTIRENVSIQAQLLKMNEKSMELMIENDELKKKNRASYRGIKDLERSHHDHAKKLASHNRVLMMLQEKRKELEELVQELQAREAVLDRLEEESERLKSQVEEQREEVEVLAKTAEEREDARLERQAEHDRARSACDDALDAVRRATDTLRSALQLPAGETEGAELLTHLRDLLTQAMESLPTPAPMPSRPLTAATEVDVPLSMVNGQQRRSVSVQSEPHRPVGVPGHCKPGALQLVPKPGQHIPSHAEKVRRSATKRATAGAVMPPGKAGEKKDSVLFSLL